MAEIVLDKNLNVRSMASVFESKFKSADYTEDMTVILPDGSTPDLAGLQVLLSAKKTLTENGASLEIKGLAEDFNKYFE